MDLIKHNQPSIDTDDISSVRRVLASKYVGQGKRIEEFEKAISGYLGGKGASCVVSNGTSAIYLALYALNVGCGDQVILPTYVCSAVLNAVHMHKAVPVLVDVDQNDFNISINETIKKVTSRIKAIIIPHIYGVPADMDKFKDLGIPIIEDCAQAIGAEYKGKKVGTIGDLSIFSFYATKLLTTGHGGAIYSRDKKLIDKIRDYRQFDCRKQYYARFNFQMTDIQAALGLSQLKKLDIYLKIRKAIAEKYEKAIQGKGIEIQHILCDGKRVFYRFVIKSRKRDKIKKMMDREGIETIVPIDEWELLHRYLKMKKEDFKVSEEIARSTLSIPLYPALKEREVMKIVKVLRRI